MTLTCLNLSNIDRFFDSIAYKRAGYGNTRIAFIALKTDNAFYILHGGLFMDTGIPRPNMQFRSENIWAATLHLSEFRREPRQIVEALLAGELSTLDGKVHFRPNEGGNFSALYDPFTQQSVI